MEQQGVCPCLCSQRLVMLESIDQVTKVIPLQSQHPRIYIEFCRGFIWPLISLYQAWQRQPPPR